MLDIESIKQKVKEIVDLNNTLDETLDISTYNPPKRTKRDECVSQLETLLTQFTKKDADRIADNDDDQEDYLLSNATLNLIYSIYHIILLNDEILSRITKEKYDDLIKTIRTTTMDTGDDEYDMEESDNESLGQIDWQLDHMGIDDKWRVYLDTREIAEYIVKLYKNEISTTEPEDEGDELNETPHFDLPEEDREPYPYEVEEYKKGPYLFNVEHNNIEDGGDLKFIVTTYKQVREENHLYPYEEIDNVTFDTWNETKKYMKEMFEMNKIKEQIRFDKNSPEPETDGDELNENVQPNESKLDIKGIKGKINEIIELNEGLKKRNVEPFTIMPIIVYSQDEWRNSYISNNIIFDSIPNYARFANYEGINLSDELNSGLDSDLVRIVAEYDSYQEVYKVGVMYEDDDNVLAMVLGFEDNGEYYMDDNGEPYSYEEGAEEMNKILLRMINKARDKIPELYARYGGKLVRNEYEYEYEHDDEEPEGEGDELNESVYNNRDYEFEKVKIEEYVDTIDRNSYGEYSVGNIKFEISNVLDDVYNDGRYRYRVCTIDDVVGSTDGEYWFTYSSEVAEYIADYLRDHGQIIKFEDHKDNFVGREITMVADSSKWKIIDIFCYDTKPYTEFFKLQQLDDGKIYFALPEEMKKYFNLDVYQMLDDNFLIEPESEGDELDESVQLNETAEEYYTSELFKMLKNDDDIENIFNEFHGDKDNFYFDLNRRCLIYARDKSFEGKDPETESYIEAGHKYFNFTKILNDWRMYCEKKYSKESTGGDGSELNESWLPGAEWLDEPVELGDNSTYSYGGYDFNIEHIDDGVDGDYFEVQTYISGIENDDEAKVDERVFDDWDSLAIHVRDFVDEHRRINSPEIDEPQEEPEGEGDELNESVLMERNGSYYFNAEPYIECETEYPRDEDGNVIEEYAWTPFEDYINTRERLPSWISSRYDYLPMPLLNKTLDEELVYIAGMPGYYDGLSIGILTRDIDDVIYDKLENVKYTVELDSNPETHEITKYYVDSDGNRVSDEEIEEEAKEILNKEVEKARYILLEAQLEEGGKVVPASYGITEPDGEGDELNERFDMKYIRKEINDIVEKANG